MGHGGTRPGAGRKPIREQDKRVQMIITISPETREHLMTLAKAKNVSPGRIIDQIIAGIIW